MDLDKKISIVTGAGQGIGEGIAKTLVRYGSKVLLVDQNGKSVKKVTDQINSEFINAALSYEADLSKSDEIDKMLGYAIDQYGHIDCI